VLRFSLPRVVEAYVGEYASGKSEMAINRALELKSQGRQVTLVDLDTVEPFYTLRPLKERLEQEGLCVIGLSPPDSFGLGETGAMLVPAARWALRREGDIILDVGYGVYGARTLNLVEGAETSAELRVIAVINYSRPMTGSKSQIIEYVKELGRVDALVANTHLGDETTLEVIEKGTRLILECAEDLGLPVDYIAVDIKFAKEWNPDLFDVPVKWITRYMPAAMW
jgi:hypothetical protein